MGGTSQTIKDRGYMTTLQVAEKIAGFGRGEGFERYRKPGSHRYSKRLNPEVATWRKRVQEAKAANLLTHHQLEPGTPILFWWSDVTTWLARTYPRAKVPYRG